MQENKNQKKELQELHAGLAALKELLIKKGIVSLDELNETVRKCSNEDENSSNLEID